MIEIARTGVPLVISAPSGAGKTTLCHRVIGELGEAAFSVSHTTRARRGSEQDGVDYFFVDDPTFERLVQEDAFLEWAHVHGRRYGTTRAQAEGRLSRGVDVFFDIDVQGGRQIAERMPDAVLVFVLPPSMAVLEERLRGRGSDGAEQIERRLRAAREEIEAATFYHYWIVNDELERAVAELSAIVRTERLRRVDKARLARSFWERP